MLPNLKLIAVASTGYEHVDVEAAREKGIIVCNDPVYGESTVAEFTFGLILSISRKLRTAFEETSRGIFEKDGLRGFDLAGKTLGVIGTGRIGSKVIKIANAFDMKILGYNRHEKKELKEIYGVQFVSLEDLLKNSDIVTVHLPYTKSTHHLINAENIKLMKKDAVLVNTARGKIVDSMAIFEAMENCRLGGVALDAFEGEEVWIKQHTILRKPVPPSVVSLKAGLASFHLLRFENTVLTPHIAYNTREAVKRYIELNIDNIITFNNTLDCKFKVNC
jgi:D-lactate dehydrogenase